MTNERGKRVRKKEPQKSVMWTPPPLPRTLLIRVFPPLLRVPPTSKMVDSEKQPRIAITPVMITALIGEWNRSLILDRGVGSTRSKDIAKSILDPVKMNGGMSLAIQRTPKTTSRKLAPPKPIALPVNPASVVVQRDTLGRFAVARLPPP